MPQLRDIARVKVDRTDGDDIAQRAYLLWSHVLPAAKRQNAYANGTYRFTGSLRSHVLAIWPEQSTASPEKIEAFSRPIYAYLYATENARCQSPNSRPPVWVISGTWQGGYAPRREESPRELQQRRAEAKITPQEAGEDREPAPVVIRKRKVTTTTTETTTAEASSASLEALNAIHRSRRDRHDEMRENAYLSVATNSQPLVAQEVAAELGISSGSARDMLHELEAAGRIFSRSETADERHLRAGGSIKAIPALLYSTVEPVPPRTIRRAVEGYLLTPSPTQSHANSKQLDYEFFDAIRSYIRNGTFTVADIAKRVNASSEAVRSRLRSLLDEKLVHEAGHLSGCTLYRVPRGSETEIRKRFKAAAAVRPGAKAKASRPPARQFSAVQPARALPAAPPEAEPEVFTDDPAAQTLQAIRDLVVGPSVPDAALTAEIERLKAENMDLRAQLETIRRALSGA